METKSTDQPKMKEKKEEVHDLRFALLGLKINPNEKVASCQLRIPSELPPIGFHHGNDDPSVVLKLIPAGEDWTHSFKLMRELSHPNILCARAIMTVEPKGPSKSGQSSTKGANKHSDNWGVVEPYDGILYDYLKKADNVMLQARLIHMIIRQIIEGLEHLKNKGYYHGNFSLKNTYYRINNVTGVICVKLACFIKKGGKKSLWQTNDVVSLGHELVAVSSMIGDTAADANPYNDLPLIDDLARKLKLVTQANLNETYEVAKAHILFWERYHRKKFFVYRIAIAMKRDDFRLKVAKCKKGVCDLPWGVDDYDGFLPEMNAYRLGEGLAAYDKNCRCSFVDFVVGLYTHELILHTGLQQVDEAIMTRHAHLCLVLRNLLGSDDGDWL
ncbi:hypothetical protein EJB05_33440 [Eragrostis curvula]|uniref:Protein kinase domain-containing protein n=1 Tax=Eragrostis curvula TaxID=38414 RepID=A0A5J9U1H1_9POAL|nr:hypothetical protein EJB05_33440 [Eragrostis curvula]